SFANTSLTSLLLSSFVFLPFLPSPFSFPFFFPFFPLPSLSPSSFFPPSFLSFSLSLLLFPSPSFPLPSSLPFFPFFPLLFSLSSPPLL
ncbi:hypothetical protein ACXWR7_10800, partial [Streptococcus pyogenes]